MRILRILPLVAALACCAGRAAPAPAAPGLFAAGDRWTAVGDSITHSGTYTQWVTLYYLTRFPGLVFAPENAGVSGDTAEGALRRFAWDIAANRPTVATIMLGMNDVGRALYNVDQTGVEVEQKRRDRLAAHQSAMRRLVADLQRGEARVVLITPSLFDETAESDKPKQEGVNGALRECAAFVRSLAAETGSALVDFHAPMERINFERQKADPKATIVGEDRIHPGPAGHLLMAYLFLKAQGAPAEVGRVELDADARKVLRAERGRVEKLRKRYNGLQWRWTAEALPWPVDPAAKAALDWAPILQDLNQDILRVTGLKAGHYMLQIDEVDVRAFSSEQLAAGVNLALETGTPQARQAHAVLELVKQRQQIIAEELRRIAQVEHQTAPDLPHPVTLEQMKPLIEKRIALLKGTTASPGTITTLERYAQLKPAQAKRQAEADRLLAAARAVAKPKRHDFRLVRME